MGVRVEKARLARLTGIRIEGWTSIRCDGFVEPPDPHLLTVRSPEGERGCRCDSCVNGPTKNRLRSFGACEKSAIDFPEVNLGAKNHPSFGVRPDGTGDFPKEHRFLAAPPSEFG